MGKIIVYILLILGATSLAVGVINGCNDTVKTVNKEFNSSDLLKKYEYFKDLSAGIDAKRADIEVYKSQLATISDKQGFAYQQTQSEMIGLITKMNSMCAEYNAGMAKFNYSFCNIGTLPASNLEPLPREMKPYTTSINQPQL